MVCRYGDDLKEMVEQVKPFTKQGKVADYIPALSLANPADLAVSIYDGTDTCFSEGDHTQLFTLQSIKFKATAMIRLSLVISANESFNLRNDL